MRREQEPAIGRGILARQAGELVLERGLVEVRVDQVQVFPVPVPVPVDERAHEVARVVDLLRRDGLHDLNHACPTSITPSLTSTLDPPIHAPTTTPSRFSARASSTLGRPISTPWAIRHEKVPSFAAA